MQIPKIFACGAGKNQVFRTENVKPIYQAHFGYLFQVHWRSQNVSRKLKKSKKMTSYQHGGRNFEKFYELKSWDGGGGYEF